MLIRRRVKVAVRMRRLRGAEIVGGMREERVETDCDCRDVDGTEREERSRFARRRRVLWGVCGTVSSYTWTHALRRGIRVRIVVLF